MSQDMITMASPAGSESKNETTINGLMHWHAQVFNKFGWIVICDDSEKWKCYHSGLVKLVECLKAKIDKLSENKLKQDELKIMLGHTEKLLDHVNKHMAWYEKEKQKQLQQGGVKKSKKGSKKGSKKSSKKGSKKSKK